MLKINMFSKADSVKGQGVGSAYTELMRLLKERAADTLDVSVNKLRKVDVTHYHTINFPYYLSTFLPGRGQKIGYVHFLPETLEGSVRIPQPFRSIFYRYVIAFYRRMDHIVVVNPTFIAPLAAYGVEQSKITYIPNFVSRSEFFPVAAEQKQQFRAKYGYEQDRFMVLGTGQIQARKGLPDFIELAKQNPDIQFVWAGGFSFGRITDGYQELKAVVDDPPANLSFPGIVDRNVINEYYNMADVFLLPSFNELFPMSVLEAFSTATPVLLRDLDLYKAIIDGYYQPAKNRDEMNQRLHQLRDQPAALHYLADQANAAADYYSEDRLIKVWENFYQEQADEKRSR